jgi:hypothetical protein
VTAIAICGLAALVAWGCGGTANAESDPEALLEETFSGEGGVDSGVLDLALSASSKRPGGGSLAATLEGPFETRGPEQPPLTDVGVSLKAQGGGEDIDIDAGLTITEDGAFVGFGGQSYAVDDATFASFAEEFASASADRERRAGGGTLLERFGLEPSEWLTDVSNEGIEEIGGVETVHISGSPDVARIIADVVALDPTGTALGALGAQELADSVGAASIDLYTGAEDKVLRRLDLAIAFTDTAASGGELDLALSFGIADVNQEQTIEAPPDPKPLGELIPGGLGPLDPSGPGSPLPIPGG